MNNNFFKTNKGKRLIIASILTITSLLSGLILGAISTTNTKKQTTDNSFAELANFLKNNWYSEIYYGKDVDENVLINQFIGALSTNENRLLDPYTYLVKKTPGTITSALGKIGITLNKVYNYPVIIEVDERGNAPGKLEVNDIVLKVNDSDILSSNFNYETLFTENMTLPGNSVTLTVLRFDDQGKATTHEVEIELVKQADVSKRYTTKQTSAYLDSIMPNNETLIVKLESFEGSDKSGTCDELKSILQANANQTTPKKNLVINLLNNGGGDLSSVVGICDLFLPKDKLVTTLQYKDGTTKSYSTTDDYEFSFDNIVIFQNNKTASASEILISTLTYYLEDKVTLVGTKSFGKGIATTSKTSKNIFNGDYTLNYACAKWLRPDGSWMGMTGSYGDEPTLFMPNNENIIVKDDIYKVMELYDTYLNYKTDDNGLLLDHVSSANIAFSMIYNKMFDATLRDDGYFDDSFTLAIKDYQELKDLEKTGIMDVMTYSYFIKDYLDQKEYYMDKYYQRVKEIING